MLDLALTVSKKIGLNESNLRQFLNETFSEVAKTYGLDGTQFQSRAKYMGDAFEACFEVIMRTFYPQLSLRHNVELPSACMIKQGSADFVVYSGGIFTRASLKLVAVIEAKGSADHITDKNGRKIEFVRPGMRRTDTVKKAICNAYQISRAYSDALFFIVTSHKPTGGNAKCMCDLAEGDIVDKIIDVTIKDELDEMVTLINVKL